MSGIAIVHHSGYGHTAKIADAVAATSGGQLLAIDAEGNLPAGGWEALAAAKLITFGSPSDRPPTWARPAGSSRNSLMLLRSLGSPWLGATRSPPDSRTRLP